MKSRILIFGDSITWGACDTEGGWANRLKKYTDKQAIKLNEDYNAVYPLGISGDNTEDLLVRFEVELKSRLDEESELVVIIAIGINDSQFNISSNQNRVPLEKFTDNLEKLMHITTQYSSKIVFVGLTPVDENLVCPMPWKLTHGYKNEHIKKYNTKIKQFASENNAHYIGFFSFFKQKNYKKLLSDGLHPNDQGHVLMFEKVLSELRTLNILE